jgi:hypothetical protein
VISGILFPAALLSFTHLLYDFHKGKVGIGKKYAKLAYFFGIFWEFWHTKGDGSDGFNFYGQAHQRYHIQENQCSFGPRLF